MTALPIVWGEGEPSDILAGRSGATAAYRALQRDYAVTPIDTLDAQRLAGRALLLLAQPRGLAPAELVALDEWVRGGGRVLVLTDPALAWPSALPLGDPRRAPAIGLLDPLLIHWGLALDDPAPGPALTERRLADGRTLRLASPGALRATGSECRVSEQGLIARCLLGRGAALVVADADLLDARLWDGADNAAVVAGWLRAIQRERIEARK